MLLNLAVFLVALLAMEAVAWAAHRYVMHGPGWGWHASHHAPRAGRFERNDLFALLFAGVAILLVWLGLNGYAPLQWVGLGMTTYGLLYAVVHDGLVHRRWPWRMAPRGRYLRRLVQAHRLHHAVCSREGAVFFGFLCAPSPARLRREAQALRERRAQRR